MMKRAALVTGANRGIGFEICRQLGGLGYAVVLTARDAERGEMAARTLRDEGIEARSHALDVTSPEDVARTVQFVEDEVGRLDVLVNNAAIAIDPQETLAEVDPEILRRTLETNLLGALRCCQGFLPLMKRQGYGRIVNVSSGRGSFSRLAAGASGGPCYRISKTALNAVTVILADETKETNILVNAMTPGWVRTRMGGVKAPLSAAEGADTAVWLATLPDDGPRGKFFKDREVFPW
jgi:NAD(P)-dependent dehydrogenase (short-subunit alcohol dehydrogenase family)